jgi:hypothetical protein
MPKMGMRETFEMQTRDRYTKVECELGVTIDGKELPAMGVVGEALEKCVTIIQEHVKQSYEVVPERV